MAFRIFCAFGKPSRGEVSAVTIENDRPIKVAVLGPGGVGGLLAAVLARQGNTVVCIAREATVDRLVERGISVRSKRFGEFAAKVDAAPILPSAVDVCLVAVKATQLDSALNRVPSRTLGDGLVVPFLNGIEHIAALRERYGDAVVPATIRVESTSVEPGIVEQASPFASVELGLADGNDSTRSLSVRALGKHFVAAGLDVEIRADEQSMLWRKLGFLAPLALLTTHESASAGAVRTARRADLLTVIHEVATVAKEAGARIDEQAVIKLFDSIPETMQSSMQRDAAAGRTIEIEAIGGAILRAADRKGLRVPVTAKLVADLRSRQKSANAEKEKPAT
jgi:2-dehydropantoate 2-reductase